MRSCGDEMHPSASTQVASVSLVVSIGGNINGCDGEVSRWSSSPVGRRRDLRALDDSTHSLFADPGPKRGQSPAAG